MAVATVAVGLVPSTASIGMAAPLILMACGWCRGSPSAANGLGRHLLSAEYAPAGKRGLFGMFTLLGGGIAAILSSLTFLGVNFTIGEYSPAFLQWGWRVPFLISSVMIALALYVRLNIDETPVFAEEKARHLVPKAPRHRGAAAAAPRDRPGRGQRAGLDGLGLHGQHLPGHVRPLPPGVLAQLHLDGRGAERGGEHHLRRDLGQSV